MGKATECVKGGDKKANERRACPFHPRRLKQARSWIYPEKLLRPRPLRKTNRLDLNPKGGSDAREI